MEPGSHPFTVHEEDTVCVKKDGKNLYGLVVDSYYDIDSDDEDEEDRLDVGNIRVAWHPNGKETDIKGDLIEIVDRAFMPGDCVSRTTDGPNSQRGTVKATEVICQLQILGKDRVICDVNSKDLSPMEYWQYDDSGFVCLDGWVGRACGVSGSLEFRFPDGARALLSQKQCDQDVRGSFKDLSDGDRAGTEFQTSHDYPGQLLRGNPKHLKGARWLQRTHNFNSEKIRTYKTSVTIQVDKLEVDEVRVEWGAKGYTGSAEESIRPPRAIRGEQLDRLKRMHYFCSSKAMLGSKCYYHVMPRDDIHSIPSSSLEKPHAMHAILDRKLSKCLHHDTTEFLNLRNGLQFGPYTPEAHLIPPFTLDYFRPRLPVKASALPAGASSSMATAAAVAVAAAKAFGGDDDYYTDDEDWAEDVSSKEEERPRKSARMSVGAIVATGAKKRKVSKFNRQAFTWSPRVSDIVPVEILHTTTFVEVEWQNGTIEKGILATDLTPYSDVPEQEFFPGDFVVSTTEGGDSDKFGCVQSVDFRGRTCVVDWMRIQENNNQLVALGEEEVSCYTIAEHPLFQYHLGAIVVRLSPVPPNLMKADALMAGAGEVIDVDLKGLVKVAWSDGTIDLHPPHHLLLTHDGSTDPEDYASDYSSEEEEASTTDTSWEECSSTDEMDASAMVKSESWETLPDDDKPKKFRFAKGTQTEEDQTVKKDSSAQVDGTGFGVQELGDNPPGEFFNMKHLAEMLYRHQGQLYKVLETMQKDGIMLSFRCTGVIENIQGLYNSCMRIDHLLGTAYFDRPLLLNTMQDMDNYRCMLIEFRMRNPGYMYMTAVKNIMYHWVQEAGHALCVHEFRNTDRRTSDRRRRLSIAKCEKITDPYFQCVSDSVPRLCSRSREYEDYDEKAARQPVPQSKICSKVDTTTGFYPRGYPDVKCTLSKLLDSFLNSSRCPFSQESVDSILAIDNPCDVLQELNACRYTLLHDEVPDWLSVQESIVISAQILLSSVMYALDNMEILKGRSCYPGQSNFSQNNSTASVNLPDKCFRSKYVSRNCKSVAAQELEWQVPSKFCAIVENEMKEHLKQVQEDLQQCENSRLEEPSQDKADESEIGCHKEIVSYKLYVAPAQSSVESRLVPESAEAASSSQTLAKSNFTMLEETPSSHYFLRNACTTRISTGVMREVRSLASHLPAGIVIKAYEDHADLLSVMIEGPENTPYEDGLFFFDVHLVPSYPRVPPQFHYISYCSERLNPNLYEDGKVCVSLLGTWSGRGTEVWTEKSNLLQVLVSIQGLILNSEPYYNEAGYEKHRGSRHGLEHSRMYNEVVLLKLIQAIREMLKNPPVQFKDEVYQFYAAHAYKFTSRLGSWIKKTSPECYTPSLGFIPSSLNRRASEEVLQDQETNDETHNRNSTQPPDFPLLPLSKGFCMAANRSLKDLETAIEYAKSSFFNLRM